MTEDARARADVALAAARAGAAVAESHFRTGIDVETKDGKTDVVTQADRDAQDAVVDAIRERFETDAVVGEEHDELKRVPETGPAWVIDPIDGTNNYVSGMRVWVVDGEPVAAASIAPALGDTYVVGPDGPRRNDDEISVAAEDDPERLAVTPTIWWAFDRRAEYAAACRAAVERFADVRRFGCAQLALANVAEGAIGGTFTNVRANPWDSVAGVKLVRDAGGRVTDLDGERWRHDSRGLVASNGMVHETVLEAARETDELRNVEQHS